MSMRRTAPVRRTARFLSLVAVAGLGAAAITVGSPTGVTATAAAKTCAPGFVPAGQSPAERELAAYLSAGHTGVTLSRALDGAAGNVTPGLCLNRQHPESPTELLALARQQATAKLAPLTHAPAGAMRAAVAARSTTLRGRALKAARGKWQALGTTPLIADNKQY